MSMNWIFSRGWRHAVIAATCALCSSAMAQSYPDGKTIRLVVPYAPGGAVDIVARLLTDKLATELGTSVIVENRPGGDGSVGSQAVASAKPDGLTLLVTVSSAHTLTPLLNKAAPDPVRAFSPVATVGTLGLMAVVRSDFPAKTFQDYVAYARSHAGKSSMGSSTSGIALTSQKLKRAAGIPGVVVVPYKGPVVPALLTGEIDMTLDPFNSVALIKAGKVRPLAVVADQRNPEFPDVPTLQELGYKDIRYSAWMGLLAPAGTPAPVVDRLHAAIASAMTSPDVLKRFREHHYAVMVDTPAQFAALITRDTAEWKGLLAEVPSSTSK
jgi:tripartite-type tricarboxylate transporter receptor subunit TctC